MENKNKEKCCSHCHELKSEDEFYKRTDGRLRPQCKPCYKAWIYAKAMERKKPVREKKPQTYRDFLRQANLISYYERTKRYM